MENSCLLFLLFSSINWYFHGLFTLPLIQKRIKKCETSRRNWDNAHADILKRLKKIRGEAKSLGGSLAHSRFINVFLESEPSKLGKLSMPRDPHKPLEGYTTESEINRGAKVARYLLSGDIRRSNIQVQELVSSFDGRAVRYDAVTEDLKFWPNASIPYTFNCSFDSEGKASVKVAMKEISSKTCVKFVPRTDEKDWVEFFHGRGCWSFPGNQMLGKQLLSLQRDDCTQKGIALHEIMHTMGYEHENNRPDRNDYVKIVWDNIMEDEKIQFSILENNTNNRNGKEYDYGSIMHYSDREFAKNRTDRTIIPKKTGAKIGQRKGLSDIDALSVNKLYCNCNETSFSTCLSKNSRRDYWLSQAPHNPTPQGLVVDLDTGL